MKVELNNDREYSLQQIPFTKNKKFLELWTVSKPMYVSLRFSYDLLNFETLKLPISSPVNS